MKKQKNTNRWFLLAGFVILFVYFLFQLVGMLMGTGEVISNNIKFIEIIPGWIITLIILAGMVYIGFLTYKSFKNK